MAASFSFLGAGVVGIYAVGTAPEARRQPGTREAGGGTAITLAPLRDARAMGYRAAVLTASPLGFPLYQRLGFRQHCELRRYVWSPTDATADGTPSSRS